MLLLLNQRFSEILKGILSILPQIVMLTVSFFSIHPSIYIYGLRLSGSTKQVELIDEVLSIILFVVHLDVYFTLNDI